MNSRKSDVDAQMTVVAAKQKAVDDLTNLYESNKNYNANQTSPETYKSNSAAYDITLTEQDISRIEFEIFGIEGQLTYNNCGV